MDYLVTEIKKSNSKFHNLIPVFVSHVNSMHYSVPIRSVSFAHNYSLSIIKGYIATKK